MGGSVGASATGARSETLSRAVHAELPNIASQDTRHLVEELQLHQEELETQNQQLRASEHELELRNRRLRAADEQLEHSRAQYQHLFELAPVGYVSLDARGVVQHANRAAERFFGVKCGLLVQRSLADAADGADLGLLQAHLQAAARAPHGAELRLRRADGSGAYARVESRPAPGGGCLTVVADISDRKRAEEALFRANQELEKRTLELAARNRELEEALGARAAGEAERAELAARLRDAERLESLGLLAGGIAHDFNNLLVGVMANADLLLETAPLLDGDVRDGLVTIKGAARSAANLTRQLLVYAGRGQPRVEAVELDGLVRDTLRLLEPTASRHIELRAELTPEGSWVVADPSQLQQVVTNLVTNALEALGGQPGKVVVRTRVERLDAPALARFPHRRSAKPGGFAVLEVEDTGPGIDAAHLSRIFEPFFTTKFTGRGLGLASALGVVLTHDAALRVHSAVGHGSRFEVAWPLAASRPATPPTAVRSSAWRGSGPVLVVDDDPVVLHALGRQLAQLGFAVTQCNSGAQALEIFRAALRNDGDRFRLAVVDRTMPGISGDRLTEMLHELEPGLPVLLVSGFSAGRPAPASGRIAFVAKPMTLGDLQRGLEGLLHAAADTAGSGARARA